MNSSSPSAKPSQLDPARLPRHVAIIMDGNGRWAKQRLLNRIRGHEQGSETVRRIVRACREIGIAALTLYAFSTENWQRPQSEVSALMALLKKFIRTEQRELIENDIRLQVIGEIARLPADVQAQLRQVIARTRTNRALLLNIALNYGGRDEIVRAMRRIAAAVREGRIAPEEINAEVVAAHLDTRGMADPDLLIRTSGEMRVSNFLLWQIAYAEIYVTDTLWPDFSREEFTRILQSYQERERRYGRVRE